MNLLEKLIFTKIMQDLMTLATTMENYSGNRTQFADDLIAKIKPLYKHPDLSDSDRRQLRDALAYINFYSSYGKFFNTLDDELRKD